METCEHWKDCASADRPPAEQSEICYRCGVAATATKTSRPLGSICTGLLGDIGNCKEVVMFGTPAKQFDAEEPRYEVKIVGPERLMKKLLDTIHGA